MTIEFTKPNRRLERLVGGTLPQYMPNSLAIKTAAAVEGALDTARDGMLAEIDALWTLVDSNAEQTTQHVEAIYFRAHDLRGLCSTVGDKILAGIAEALCTYIEETKSRKLTPRANIIWLHASSLMRAAQDKDTSEALGQYLIESLCALRKKELDVPCPPDCECSTSPDADTGQHQCSNKA